MTWNTDGLNLPEAEMPKVGRIDIIASNGNDGIHYEQHEEKCKMKLTSKIKDEVAANFLSVLRARLPEIPRVPEMPEGYLRRSLGYHSKDKKKAMEKYAKKVQERLVEIKIADIIPKREANLARMMLDDYETFAELQAGNPGLYQFIHPNLRAIISVDDITTEEINEILGWEPLDDLGDEI